MALIRLKNLTQTFEYLKIIIDLDGKVNTNTLFGFAIQNAIDTKQPAKNIIKTIAEQANDNYKLIAEVIGENLTKRICNIKF